MITLRSAHVVRASLAAVTAKFSVSQDQLSERFRKHAISATQWSLSSESTSFVDHIPDGWIVEADKVVIAGAIESRDEDGMTYLRLASDCLLMIESGDNLRVGSHLRLSLPSSELKLTPLGG